jgi:MurNAc alpha-1-phosphate uridylyltransferase
VVTSPIKQALILAAGLGTRMRPLTDSLPKPLIPVHNKPMIAWIIERLINYNIEKLVVTTYTHAELLTTYLSNSIYSQQIEIIFSHEEHLLDSGGGIVNALLHFNTLPFFALNCDVIWGETEQDPLKLLNTNWHDNMNGLILLCEKNKFIGYDGSGDFDFKQNQLTNIGSKPYAFPGLRIFHPKIFADAPQGNFHLFKDFLFQENRLAKINAVLFDGYLMHIGTPSAIRETERLWDKIY